MPKVKNPVTPAKVSTSPSLHVRFGTGEEAVKNFRRLSVAAALSDLKVTAYAEKVLRDHIASLPPVK